MGKWLLENRNAQGTESCLKQCALNTRMNILVTGGDGFIGSHLIKQLEENGHQVTNISSDVQLLDDDAFGNPQVIYHLGAFPRVGYSLDNPEKVLSNNYLATLRVLEYCRFHPATRLINISSSSVKFSNLLCNPYALSKKFGEDMVDMYRMLYGVLATSVRLFNVYGPGEAEYGQFTTLVKACKKRVIAGMNLRITGDGSVTRDFTHVADVVNGLLVIDRLMQQGMVTSRFELGSGKPTSVADVAEEFQRGTNLKIEHAMARPFDPEETRADPDRRPHGWFPVFDVLDYIQDWKAAGCPND